MVIYRMDQTLPVGDDAAARVLANVQAEVALLKELVLEAMRERDAAIAQAKREGQEAMRERAANELEAAFAECDTLNLLHGAARIRALPVE